MVKTIALVLLASVLAATVSASSSNAVQWKLRPRVEYEFELSGRSLAGLPALQGQYSGVQYGGRVRVQGLTADSAIIRLEKMSWSAMHGRFQSNWWSADPQSNATLAGHNHMGSMAMPLSGAAAVARFQDGQVQSVLVSPAAKDWEVNMLQGVLGHMQLQGAASAASAASASNSLHGRGRGSGSSQDQQTDQAAYRVLENGVSGRCLVQYEVSPANAPAQMSAAEAKVCAGKPYVQITKTKNFTDCEQYAEQSRGLPRCSPAGNACASLWARNSISQMIGCGAGDDMQLLQAVTSSSMQAELQTREDSRASVFSSVNMTLASVQPVRQRLPIPKDGVVLNGLGYRVAGKQANGQWGLDSDYGSSEEADDSMDSVEVVRQPSGRRHQQQQDSSEQDSSEQDSNDSDSSSAQHKKHSGHKKSHKANSSSQDSSSEENDNSAPKHKKHQDSSSEENDTSASKHKNLKHKKHQDSSSEEDSMSSPNTHKHKKNNHSDENDSDNGKHKNLKHKQHQDSSSEEDSNPRKHKKNNHSDESDSEESKPKKSKHSRKPRSAKANTKDQGDVIVDDLFAGVLSPAAVQKNATLRSGLQQRLAQDVLTAASELSRQDGPSPRTMERLSMAVRVARALSADQLASVQGQLRDQTAKDLLRDVLAMCGSEACVQQVLAMIKDRKMNPVAAQMALSSLADRVSVPSRGVLKHIQDVYMTASEQQVKIAAALAMGNLAGRAPRPVAASTASFLSSQLAKQNTADGSQLRAPLTYALGSTATTEAAKALVKIAKDSKVTPYLRAQAIIALRPCAQRSPALVRDTLLGLFHDPTESAPVRMAAVSLLVYTKPSLPLWQRLAVSTFYEPNMAVSAYVWATIHSFANLQDPAFRQQTQFARLALPLARSMPQGAHMAFNVVASSVDAQLDRLVHEHASFMGPADAANAYYRRVTRRAGVSTLDQEVDLWGASPDDLMQAAVEAVFGREDKSAARPAAKDVPHSTRSIHDKLSIVRRQLQDPQGHLRLTLQPFVNNMFLAFDKDTPNRVAKAAVQLVDKLHAETGFHAQQMGGQEVSVATVTEMGFPVNLRIQAPWLVRVQGSAQVHRNHSAQANITCLYSAGLSAQLSVQPSWASREYMAAVNGHAMVQIPATAIQAQVNATSGRLSVSVQPAQPQQAAVVARVALQPLTAYSDLSRAELASESASAHNASMGQGQGDAVVMSLWDNVSLNLRAPVERSALPAWIRDSRTVLGFPALGRPLTASRLELVASRSHGLNVSVALVKGMLQSGDLQVVYPDELRQDDEPATPAAPATEAPVTSTTTEVPTTTTAAPAVVRAPRGAEHGRRFHGNGSLFVDDGDVDFTRSVFNATTLNPYNNRVNGSSELYVLSQVLGGMSAGRGYVLGVNVTSEDLSGSSQAASRYSGFWTVGANLGGRLLRAGLFARSDSDNAQVAATGAVLRDVAARADVAAALHQLPSYMIKAEYQQVDAKAVKKIVTVAMETDRSAAKTHRLWRAAKEQFCVQPGHAMETGSLKNATVSPACRAILGAANTPDQFNVTVNYNNPAEEAWGSGVHGVLEAAKAYLWNQGNIAVDAIAPGNGNELGAGLTVQANGKIDGWLQTPRTLTKVVGAGAPVASTLLSAANKETRAFCGATASRLVTLDGVQGDIQLNACWHLLAKDCSGKSRVAVLARADKPQSDDIHVEINIDNYQVARLTPDGAATLNGVLVADHANQTGSAVQVRDAADVQVMNIVRSEDGALIVNLPDHGMSVVYGNSSVVIQAGASLHGRLCGVCGKFDGSFSGDLLNPKNKAEKNIQSLVDSYAIKDAQCSASGKSRQ